ncbi:hypothetical protein RchiOBHm_Chr1g0324631 [Rosa chinensis]|uniref:Uncharacterized protein n=1 Tax=Rosa chinensis TaxID=74649 RepID=A0A2P6S9W1_ROSCH|nr:hypothetical protein RchiOBHm_Chr1g0324631 [Rosa chinensis]
MFEVMSDHQVKSIVVRLVSSVHCIYNFVLYVNIYSCNEWHCACVYIRRRLKNQISDFLHIVSYWPTR